MFTLIGLMKLTSPLEKLSQHMPWVGSFALWQVKTIGFLELLVGLGVLLPHLTKVAPVLTPISAVCISLIMVGAIILHSSRGEMSFVMMNAAILLLAAFVAYGRFRSL